MDLMGLIHVESIVGKRYVYVCVRNQIEIWDPTCYISNRVYLRPRTLKTSYEIWKGKKPNLKHLHEFGSPCYILNDREPRGKFDAKSDKGVFLGYCTNNCAYKVYNKRTKVVIESINV